MFLHIPGPAGQVSDGFHTFDELYDHRCRLFIALMKCNSDLSWISRKHDDGTALLGWFIGGIDFPRGAITYHISDQFWTLATTAGIPELPRAPKWDGHESQDVIIRLGKWIAPQLYP